MAIGFKLSSGKGKKKIADNKKKVDEMQVFLDKELGAIENIEKQIRVEFKELEDFKHNLEIIQGQMIIIRQLIEKREGFVLSVLQEQEKPKTKIDLGVCFNYFKLIGEIDAKLYPLVSLVNNELVKLLVDDTHKLYKKSKNNVKEMHKVDKIARKLIVELKVLGAKVNSISSELQKVQQGLQRLALERQNRPMKKVPLGFKS